MSYVKLTVSICLAKHFFQQALNADINSSDADKHVKKLKKLVKMRLLFMNNLSAFINISYSVLILSL